MAQQDNSRYLLYGGGLLLLYVAGKKVFQKLGIVETAADVQAAQASAQVESENYFDPTYYKDKIKIYGEVMSLSDKGVYYAKKLYNAKGLFNDDEDTVFGVFRALNYKTQVSVVADAFFKLYNQDLKNFLQPPNGFLSSNEWNNLVNILSKLKTGVKINGVYQ
jgi:hypothetical protein